MSKPQVYTAFIREDGKYDMFKGLLENIPRDEAGYSGTVTLRELANIADTNSIHFPKGELNPLASREHMGPVETRILEEIEVNA